MMLNVVVIVYILTTLCDKKKHKIIVCLKQARPGAGHSGSYTVALCDTKNHIVTKLFAEQNAAKNVIHVFTATTQATNNGEWNVPRTIFLCKNDLRYILNNSVIVYYDRLKATVYSLL